MSNTALADRFHSFRARLILQLRTIAVECPLFLSPYLLITFSPPSLRASSNPPCRITTTTAHHVRPPPTPPPPYPANRPPKSEPYPAFTPCLLHRLRQPRYPYRPFWLLRCAPSRPRPRIHAATPGGRCLAELVLPSPRWPDPRWAPLHHRRRLAESLMHPAKVHRPHVHARSMVDRADIADLVQDLRRQRAGGEVASRNGGRGGR